LTDVLQIDALAYGGNGIGRQTDGKAVFVPYSAPGDQLLWRPARVRKRHIEAELVELLIPGEGRCDPVCPVFGQCGGCQWQHLTYPRQLHWKQRFLADALERHAGLAEVALLPAVGSADPWHYRNRAQFKCHVTADGPLVGFYRRGSHFVIPILHCPILRPEINQSLDFLRQLLESSAQPDKIPQLDVAVGDDGAVRVVCHFIGPVDRHWQAWAIGLADERGYGLFLQQGRKSTLQRLSGPEDLRLQVDQPPMTLGFGPGGFAQVNSGQNRRLVDAVVALAALRGSERLLDLFCGMGNFSLPLARRSSRLTGVEDYPASIARAEANARLNRIDNVDFLVADAAAFMATVEQRYELVLLDPPRVGAGREVVQALLRLNPERIIYISCDPMTLARDLALLLRHSYRVVSSQVFDLFPQTYHLESVTLLERR